MSFGLAKRKKIFLSICSVSLDDCTIVDELCFKTKKQKICPQKFDMLFHGLDLNIQRNFEVLSAVSVMAFTAFCFAEPDIPMLISALLNDVPIKPRQPTSMGWQ